MENQKQHYTEGGPWFKNYRLCEYNKIWINELNEMMNEQLHSPK